MSKPARRQPAGRVKAQECLELRLAGKSWQEIADATGYRDRSGPQKAVERLLDTVEHQEAGKYRSIESARLDALQGRFWTDALGGDLKAAEFVLKVSGQRAKLLGLNVPDRVILAQAAMPSTTDYAELLAELLTEAAAATLPDKADTDDWIDP